DTFDDTTSPAAPPQRQQPRRTRDCARVFSARFLKTATTAEMPTPSPAACDALGTPSPTRHRSAVSTATNRSDTRAARHKTRALKKTALAHPPSSRLPNLQSRAK